MADAQYTTLTDQDKLGIVKSHVKNKEYALYNDDLEKLAELSLPVVNQQVVDAIDERSVANATKLAALQAEASNLEAAIALAESS